MISRKVLINLHLILASVFMPFMLMMPLTGSLYILDYQGDQTKIEVFKITEPVPTEKKEMEDFFRQQFAKQNIDYKFEYVRTSKSDYTMRPTTRTHYVASKNDSNELVVSRIEPTLLKRLIELHKGHGPVAMRWFEVAFGVALILTTLSGLWLAWTVKAYRTVTLSAFTVGLVVILVCLI